MFFIFVIILIINCVLPLSVYLRNSRHPKPKSLYDTSVDYTYNFDQGFNESYIGNPVLDMSLALENSEIVINIVVSRNNFSIFQYVDGYLKRKQKLAIGTDIYYTGSNTFAFYKTWFNLGQMFPGTSYAFEKCIINVNNDALEVSVTNDEIGLGLFVIPDKRYQQYDFSCYRQTNEGEFLKWSAP